MVKLVKKNIQQYLLFLCKDSFDDLYRLNDEKLIQWLRCKVEKVMEKVDSVSGIVATASQASGFTPSKKGQKLKQGT
jgi:hypothetical protein